MFCFMVVDSQTYPHGVYPVVLHPKQNMHNAGISQSPNCAVNDREGHPPERGDEAINSGECCVVTLRGNKLTVIEECAVLFDEGKCRVSVTEEPGDLVVNLYPEKVNPLKVSLTEFILCGRPRLYVMLSL